MATKAQITTAISDNILTGGSRTTADKTRTVLDLLNNSYVNITDAGLVLQAELGYSAVITPTSNYSFATKKYVDDNLGAEALSVVLGIGRNTGATTIIFDQATPNTVPIFDSANQIISSTISATVFNYISGLTGNVETRLTNLETGLSWKGIVKVIATTNQAITGTYTLDGYALQVGDRVLLAGQTLGKNNGIYVVASGAWTRSTDFDGTADNIKGAVIPCEQGTFADQAYVCTNTGAIIIGTTPLTFTLFGGTVYTGTGGRISVSGSVIDIDAAYIGQNTITTLGTVTTGTLGSGAKILVGSDATGDIWFNGGSGAISRSAALNFDGTTLSVGTYLTGGTATIYSKGVNTAIALDSSGTGSGTQIVILGTGAIRSYLGATSTDCLTVYDSTANHLWFRVNNSTGVATASDIITNSVVPTIAAGTGAGTSPTISIAGTNKGGVIDLTTGTAPSVAGIVATITFSGSLSAPNGIAISLTPRNSNGVVGTAVYAVKVNATSWKIVEASGLGLTNATNYIWNYTTEVY